MGFTYRWPRTLNGLILEHLEDIPESHLSVRVAGHPMEIVEIEENRIKLVRVYPKKKNQRPIAKQKPDSCQAFLLCYRSKELSLRLRAALLALILAKPTRRFINRHTCG